MFEKFRYPLGILSLSFLTLTAGCLESPGAGVTEGSIPNLTIECSSAQVLSPHCRSGISEQLWVGITKNFDLDCAVVLSGFSGRQRDDYFEAIAENIALTHSGTLSRGTVSSWITPGGAAITSLTTGSYKACAFIESTSGDDRLQTNEPLGAAVIDVGGTSPQIVNDWISY